AILAVMAVLGVSLTSCCSTCRKSKPIDVKGSKWALIELNDKVVGRTAEDPADRMTLALGEDMRITGKGDCNSFTGAYTLNGTMFNTSGVASTRMLCLNQPLEDEYFRALDQATTVNIDGKYLLLKDAQGKIIASFERIAN
ncbi:MAG: META domain-containing protein, partial [Rikenellaceae bacterium]|nr:META domain-containing protein [Rikenellaceae bacterium]